MAAERSAPSLPARLDALSWSRFHTLVVVALGITWILDGLEVTIAGALSGALRESPTLRFDEADIGATGSAYLVGAVLGAIVFGALTDKLGRKKLFFATLGVYALATVANAFAWDLTSFAICRFLTGAGIGGEYSAMNSAIQELVPARYRGRTDLAVSGSFWLGAALGAIASIVLLEPGLFPPDLGWRMAFGIGGAISLLILLLRRYVPESPRWLIAHGRVAEAARIVSAIDGRPLDLNTAPTASPRRRAGALWRSLIVDHPRRTVLGMVLMSSQAFFYNAIFFTHALVLTRFYGVPAHEIGWYILPFAAGNFLGPVLLGPLFDTLGRKPMIAATYAASGVLLAVAGLLFRHDLLTATTQTAAWTIIFFAASAAASSAYLTVGESFPVEIRAGAISVFYAAGTLLGGAVAPYVFGLLIATGERGMILQGYLFASALMIIAAVTELVIGIAAERKPLEELAQRS
jgi:MFS family permease